MELQSRSTIKRSSDPSFRWGFIALLSILVVSAFAQPPSEAWDSVISAIEGNAEFPSGAVVIGADDLGIVFNHTVGTKKRNSINLKGVFIMSNVWLLCGLANENALNSFQLLWFYHFFPY